MIVLSDAFWQRRFNRAPSVVGQVAVVNATPMTIIGVAEPGFFGVLANEQPAFFVPTTMKPQLTPTRDDFDDRQSRWLNIVGRLAPGRDAANRPRPPPTCATGRSTPTSSRRCRSSRPASERVQGRASAPRR